MSNGKNPTALDYFRAGRDTADIAIILGLTEAEALKAVNLQRSAALGLSDPYQQPEPRPASRFPYAGHSRLSLSGGG